MRLHCPHCNTFLAVGSIHPKTPFRCYACKQVVTPHAPNASFFACSNCGLTRPLDLKYVGKLVRCSQCRTTSRVDSLYLANKKPLIESPFSLQPSEDFHASDDRRLSPRYAPHEMTAYMGLLVGAADVCDISATGVCFTIASPDKDFAVGEKLHSDIFYQNELVLKKAPAIVVRHTVKTIGCRFDLSDKKLERDIQELIDQAVLREKFLQNQVHLDIVEDSKQLQLRQHDYF